MKPGESFVEQPIRSLQTMLRIIAENDPALPTVVPDGIYGPTTMNAVTAFQRQYGLPITGITDQETWEKIVEIYDIAEIQVTKTEPIEIIIEPGEIFRIGESNAYIYLLQSILTQLSNDNPTISRPIHNGVLDSATSNALAAFQFLAGLPTTGELDKITWKYLVKQFTLSANREANR
ncbi:MAG: peptidoglycan-binding protein [Oscillospiraceae bacterium]|nr:peptidoglycan-binding protein [Oscillospiraceae bacterium]